MPLHTIHRPKTLSDVRGNASVVESLRSVLQRDKDRPHSFLFTGNSGCGKSTMTRVLKTELDCSDSDCHIYNSSNQRGIDTIRDIIEAASFAPMSGDVKLFVLEECFARGTLVLTTTGRKPIEQISVGDRVINLCGENVVEKVFRNKVDLSRVLKLQLSDGTVVFCSKDHQFLTSHSPEIWTPVKELETTLQSEEGTQITRVGVESIEIYKRGDNDQSFRSVIGNKERNQGFVEFYDLQIANHPSYIANSCVVHNCHQISSAAQEALLLILEEPPDHVYFALATTEPEKLKPTVKRRCHSYEMKPLNTIELNTLLLDTLEKENINDFPENVIAKIISVCDGSPGKALNLLDTVVDVVDDEQAFQVIEEATVSEASVAEIARVLLAGNGQWFSIAKMLEGLRGEPESLRRAFLGYFGKVLLNPRSNHDKTAEIMMSFAEPVFNTGKPGLDMAVYFAFKSSC